MARNDGGGRAGSFLEHLRDWRGRKNKKKNDKRPAAGRMIKKLLRLAVSCTTTHE